MATNSNLQKTELIARFFELTPRRVQQLTAEGILPAVETPSGRRYDLIPTIKAYIQYLKKRMQPQGAQDLAEEKMKADIRLKTARAEIEEKRLATINGELHAGEDVSRLTNELVYSVRSMLLSLPSRMAIDLAGLDTPAEISKYIENVIGGCLQELAAHEYDPEKYKELVSTREKLIGLGLDDDDGDDEDDDDTGDDGQEQ